MRVINVDTAFQRTHAGALTAIVTDRNRCVTGSDRLNTCQGGLTRQATCFRISKRDLISLMVFTAPKPVVQIDPVKLPGRRILLIGITTIIRMSAS